MAWTNWIWLISSIAPWVFLAAIFLGRNWIKAEIEQRVEHRFNEKLENLRADLHAKASEIAALRDGVLGGRAQRQSLLDKRRLEAIERTWSAVIALAPLKFISSMMAVIKFDAAASAASRDPKLREFF